jgi:hypothetical protein
VEFVKHDASCPRSGKWYVHKDCREFSTDGTALGADIAHLYGVADESLIEELQELERIRERDAALTGMEEEQADWEES